MVTTDEGDDHNLLFEKSGKTATETALWFSSFKIFKHLGQTLSAEDWEKKEINGKNPYGSFYRNQRNLNH
jgi:hypothetical protein